MIRIGEAVQETDRHCLDLLCGESIDCASDAGLIQRRQYLALRVDALAHGQSQPARNERRRQIDIEVVLLETVFVPDLDDVAEPFGGQKGGLGALSLYQRIRSERRAMNDQTYCAGPDARLGGRQAQGSQNTVFRCTLRSQDFSRE